VRVRWFDAEGRQITLMLCAGLHSAEARLDRPAPARAVAVRVESATIAATYTISRDGRTVRSGNEIAAE
jgi:hypothetical protein